MKFYLFISLLFLNAWCLPISADAQENAANQHPITSETPPLPSKQHNDSTFTNSPNQREVPMTWPDHVERESDNFQTKFFNMLFILGLLIGFMILASWALKRMMRTRMTQLNTTSTIKLLETRYLSPKATLYLVEVQDQTFLIAESPTNVTYLATLPLEEGTPSPGSSKSS